MKAKGRSHSWKNPVLQRELPAGAKQADHLGQRRNRLSILFAGVAVSAIAVATMIVNLVIGGLAEDNLIRVAEENTARDAEHIHSMMRMMGPMAGQDSMQGMSSTGAVTDGKSKPDMQQSMALTLESLTSPEGLPSSYPHLVEALNIVEFTLFDLDGTVVWSTDPRIVGLIKMETPPYQKALAGGISSKLTKSHEVVDSDGVIRRLDVVETYLPLRETPSGQIIGVIGIYRDVAGDVAIQVDDAKAAVLWTTVTTMGGLFLLLGGFIVVADVNIYWSNRRALVVVEEANQTLEERVRQRTQELEEANEQLLEAQDQLVRTEKLAAIGQLAGGVAHDLRNPLGAVKNAAYYLKRKLVDSEVAQSNPRIGQFLGIIEEEVEHSNQIISDLMTFARVGTPSLSPTKLGEVIENALASVEVRENVQVVKQFDPDLPGVLADGEQLYRVCMNLAVNAQDAMPDGGELTVSARRTDGFAEVAFSDTGIGISEEDMKKIFEPLFTTKTKGTGLGLAVCQQIVSKHGGTIDVASKQGEGTTFTVKLPLNGEGS